MSKPLSPEARAVLRAYRRSRDERRGLALALKALSKRSMWLYSNQTGEMKVVSVDHILDVAAELEVAE